MASKSSMNPIIQNCPCQGLRAGSGIVYSITVPEVGIGMVKKGFMEEVRLEPGLTECVGFEQVRKFLECHE